MSISLDKFVNIQIVNNNISSTNTDRDTVVLITSEGEAPKDAIYSSAQEFIAAHSTGSFTNTTEYVNVYFNNSGNKLHVYEGVTQTSDPSQLSAFIRTLQDEYIVIAVVGLTFANAKTVAQSLDTASTVSGNSVPSGIHRKILLCRVAETDIYSSESLVEELNATGIYSLCAKYSDVNGAEMTIGAYLSNIVIYGNDTVHDYSYTSEVLDSFADDINHLRSTIPSSISDDDIYDVLDSNHINFDYTLAGVNRNIGGDMTSGLSLVNEFMLIVLQQTVTDRVLSTLASKLKGSTGLARLRSAISDELNRYVTNGYLTTDKIWTDESWTEVYNGTTYTIIDSNTPIPNGYIIQILPFTSLSESDKSGKYAPPIFLILADQYSIRKVNIYGEVI